MSGANITFGLKGGVPPSARNARKMSLEEIKRKEAVMQNLEDAGCGRESIEEYFALEGKGKIKDQLILLERHREELLNAVHENQKKIDCLDYLIYQIRGSKKRAGTQFKKIKT